MQTLRETRSSQEEYSGVLKNSKSYAAISTLRITELQSITNERPTHGTSKVPTKNHTQSSWRKIPLD